MKNSADLGGCYPPRPSAPVDNTRKLNSTNASLLIQNNSKFNQNNLKLAYLGRCSVYIDSASLSRNLGDKGLFRSANILQITDVVLRVAFLLFLLWFDFRQYLAAKRVKCVQSFCSHHQNNATSSPSFLGQRFNNLQLWLRFWRHRFIMTKFFHVWSTVASHAGVFRGARISSLPFVGREEIRASLKTLAREARSTVAAYDKLCLCF